MILFILSLLNWFLIKNRIIRFCFGIILIIVCEIDRKNENELGVLISLGEIASMVSTLLLMFYFILDYFAL